VLKKRYTIDRGGFEGPLVAQLAERQGRHLQGVSGPVVAIPAGESRFEYPLTLPPWMELGRTSRTNLMLTGESKARLARRTESVSPLATRTSS
jgi:hypothetical protein